MRLTAFPVHGTTVEVVVAGTVRGGEWTRPPVVSSDAAVLYVHGGGFVAGSPRGYRGGVAGRLTAALGLPVFVVDYRLAPEHRNPAAGDDIDAAFEWLVRQASPRIASSSPETLLAVTSRPN